MTLVQKTELAMVEYFSGDPRRISHFVKVHDFARLIGIGLGLPERELEILEVAACVHDIGIRRGEELYGRNDGEIQQLLGPKQARKLLCTLTDDGELVERVCWLVGHHHTMGLDGSDYRALIEADFIVNAYEDSLSKSAINTAYKKIFVTETGRQILKNTFDLD